MAQGQTQSFFAALSGLDPDGSLEQNLANLKKKKQDILGPSKQAHMSPTHERPNKGQSWGNAPKSGGQGASDVGRGRSQQLGKRQSSRRIPLKEVSNVGLGSLANPKTVVMEKGSSSSTKPGDQTPYCSEPEQSTMEVEQPSGTA